MTREIGLTRLVGESDVRTLIEDSKGNIWIGGFSRGVALVRADSLDAQPRLLVPHVDVPAGFIRAFCEDGLGRMWVGTRFNGCMIISNDGVQVLSAADVLPSDAVWTITRDHEGTMWLGTSQGLVAINPHSLLPDPIGNDLVREPVVSSGVSRKGILWYVTQTGLGLIDRSRLRAPSSTVNVRLARMDVDGRSVGLTEELEFSHDQNNCVFTFLASTLHNTRDVLYQYRLINADKEWQPPTRERSVAYASLRPGTYTFVVRATRVGASEYGASDSVTFTIDPAFWEEWWFRLAGMLVVLALAVTVYRRRVIALEREKRTQQEFSARLIESQENERKRIAGELHDSLVQELLVAKNRSLMGLKNVHDTQRVRQELGEISSALGAAIDEVRGIAHNLRPYQLDRMGLSKAVRSLLSKLAESTTIRLQAEVDDVDVHLDAMTTIHLYRILQEVLNNILKHSEASSATVSLRRNGSVVELRIADDGKGMSADGEQAGGFGLDGIAQRSSLMRGESRIISSPGGGTTVVVRIPVHIKPASGGQA
jgi:signal transduction histidine kinase